MSRITARAAIAVAGLLAAVLAPLPATAAAPGAPLAFGLYETGNSPPYSFPVTPAYDVQYYGWHERFQAANAQAAWNAGTEIFGELQTCGNPCDESTSVPIADVSDGSSDAYLTSFAQAVAAFGHPVLLTFDHEMNGGWYPWGDTEITAAQWIAAWQHVTTLISSIAPNVSWVWAPNTETGAAPVANYWPGNGYASPNVNVIGLDGYFANSGSTWASTFARSLADAESVSGNQYPFMVAETGVPSADSDNVAQIDNLVSGALSAHASALIYFDHSQWSFTSAGQAEFIQDTG